MINIINNCNSYIQQQHRHFIPRPTAGGRIAAGVRLFFTDGSAHQEFFFAASRYCLHPAGLRLLLYPNSRSCLVRNGSGWLFHGDRSSPYELYSFEYPVASAMTGTKPNLPLPGVIRG